MRSLRIVFSLFLFFTLFLLCPLQTEATDPLINPYDTLTNPRLSFKAIVSGTVRTNIVSIVGGTEPAADKDVRGLYPGDPVCFVKPTESTCMNGTTYTTDSVDVGNTRFSFTPLLSGSMPVRNDYATVIQKAQHTITFKPHTYLSGTNYFQVKIPRTSSSSTCNDGIPDYDGFDGNGFTTSNINPQITMTGVGVTVTKIGTTYDTIPNYHKILIQFSVVGTATTANTITVGIGSTATLGVGQTGNFINPAPCLTCNGGGVHFRGKADIYTFAVETQDSSGITIDSSNIKIGPVEGVSVIASIEESLDFKICGVNTTRTINSTDDPNTCTSYVGSGGTGAPANICGVTTESVTTNSVQVPFGAVINNQNYNAAQYLEVSTNSNSGYNLTILEDDQMGMDANICSGTAPSTGDYTFGSISCIRDTTCQAGTPCTYTTASDWTGTTKYGIGYSIVNNNNSDATFQYNDSGRSFNTKPFPDADRIYHSPALPAQNILAGSGPSNQSSAFICYRLLAPPMQPPGIYSNVLKFAATPKF